MTIAKINKWISCLGILTMLGLGVYLWHKGILSSQENLKNYIAGFGMAAGLIFVLVQIVQVVIPIIPGGVSCLVGVVFFGSSLGFIYNYVGICIGSVIAFLIARNYGRPLLESMFKAEQIEKYESWTGTNHRFARLFALAIFFPVAPDDFLCYLAGTTKMKLKTFTAIILLGKPASIAIYSLGLAKILQVITSVMQ